MKRGCFSFFVFLSIILNAQDAQFTMPYSSSLYLNPAFAGSDGLARISAAYRNQWPNIYGNFVTSSVSFDRYIKFIRGGIGISYFDDRAGAGTTIKNGIIAVYAAHIPVFKNRWIIKSALQCAYGRNYLDWSHLTFAGTVSSDKLKEVVTYPDFSSGLLSYSDKFFAGLAVHHLNEPDITFISHQTNLPRKYTAHAGADLVLHSEKKVMLSPSVVYLQQQDYRSLFINLAIQGNFIGASVGYRNGDNLITALKFRTKYFKMGYAYDFYFSRLGIVTTGSHEIMLSFLFNKKARPENFLAFDSASF